MEENQPDRTLCPWSFWWWIWNLDVRAKLAPEWIEKLPDFAALRTAEIIPTPDITLWAHSSIGSHRTNEGKEEGATSQQTWWQGEVRVCPRSQAEEGPQGSCWEGHKVPLVPPTFQGSRGIDAAPWATSLPVGVGWGWSWELLGTFKGSHRSGGAWSGVTLVPYCPFTAKINSTIAGLLAGQLRLPCWLTQSHPGWCWCMQQGSYVTDGK